MDGWMEGWWIDGRMEGWWIDGWMYEWMEGWWIDGWMYECMEDGWMEGWWIDGCMNGWWIDGCMKGWWIDGCMYSWLVDGAAAEAPVSHQVAAESSAAVSLEGEWDVSEIFVFLFFTLQNDLFMVQLVCFFLFFCFRAK